MWRPVFILNPWWGVWPVLKKQACVLSKVKLWPKLSALLGLDIWVSKWSDVATDILSRHTPPHLKQLHGLKKRSAPDCSDYATSSTMAMCPSHRVMTPPILLACPITLIIGTLPQISTTPPIRGDGYPGIRTLADLLFSCQPFLLPLKWFVSWS